MVADVCGLVVLVWERESVYVEFVEMWRYVYYWS